MYALETCANCNGKGTRPVEIEGQGIIDQSCTACDGTGRHLVAVETDQLRRYLERTEP